MTKYWRLSTLLFIAACSVALGQPSRLSSSEVTLIREALHLQSALGPILWPGWVNPKPPFLLKTCENDFLINHPHPPSDFSGYFDSLWGDTVWVRANRDTSEFQACYPINGSQTVVISAPSDDYNPCLWVLKAAHELFHVYQGLDRVVNPFVGPYAATHELSFPFDYSNAKILASCRIEAELLFNLVTKNQLGQADSAVSKRVLRDMQTVFDAVVVDTLHLRYKRWIEWKEGVALYTERRLSDLARNPVTYQPTKEFSALFPSWNYAELWLQKYESNTNPIRFIGEGVRGRLMFYYSGMAKAYVLDRINPRWRSEYFKKTLDAMIIE